MQSKEQLEAWWSKPDAWGYTTNEDDAFRKEKVIHACGKGYKRAIDIGCGEGWLTKDLPAEKIYGLELSDKAAARFPKNVERVLQPEGEYDLVVATGVLYSQYNYKLITHWIKEHARGRIVLSNIADWEIIDPDLLKMGKVVREEYFPYREYTQHLLVIDYGTTTT